MSIDLFNKLILKCFWYCNTNLYNFFLIIITQIINHKPFFLLCYSQSQVFISFFAICLSNLLLLLYAFLSVSRSCRRRWFLFFNFSSFSRFYVLCFISLIISQSLLLFVNSPRISTNSITVWANVLIGSTTKNTLQYSLAASHYQLVDHS